MQSSASRGRHHASYMLVDGMWIATCRDCGFQVSEARRQRAAGSFRHHIRDAIAGLVNLRDGPERDSLEPPPRVEDGGESQTELSTT